MHHAELHPVPVKSQWYHIGIDFVDPISPAADDGNIFTMSGDYFTKRVNAVPTVDKFACTAAIVLLRYFACEYRYFISDLHEDGTAEGNYI